MNILNLLTKKKHVIGLEINSSYIRISYFKTRRKINRELYKNNKDAPEDEIITIEEPIPKGVVSGGLILEKDILVKILRNLWKKASLSKSYAIVSIPEDKIYSKVFSFPKDISQSHLEQAINLAIDFQLPVKKDESYIGWENITDKESKNTEILISAISQNIIKDYIKIFNISKIKILAIESHLKSITRSIKIDEGKTILLKKNNSESLSILILKENLFKFSRTIPLEFLHNEEYLNNEISNIKNSFESNEGEKIDTYNFDESNVNDKYSIYKELTEGKIQSKWLISLGAAIRGKLKEGQDNQISLLPVSTAEAYLYQRSKVFIILIRNIIVWISIFFIFVFFIAFIFISSVSQTINNRIKNIPMLPNSNNINENQALIDKINSLSNTSQIILSNTPNWSILIDEIKSRTIDGITISNFKAQSINDPITITGISRDRYVLNQYKKSLQDSAYLTNVELPITNLEQKGDIPFTITFNIKNISMIYYK